MLEGLVAGLLNRFLGMYVKNFDPTQLKVGIWSGDVKLRNLELRKEALDQLKLPINVMEGHLGELTIVIPWSNLRGAPVKVFIEDVFLLASPKEESAYDQEEEERRQHRVKMEKLDSAELLKERSQEGLSQEEQKKSQSFTESLVTKIVDNLQVTVKNIHVRYEDAISAPGHPFALGVTLEEFSAVSTDGEWKPTFIQNSTKSTHKLAKLEALAVYWNTDTTLLGPGRETSDSEDVLPHHELIEKFKEMIGKGDNSATKDHQFILKPVSGQAKIELDKTGAANVPKFKGSLLFDEIGVVLDDDQYRDGLMMVDLFHYFIRHQEYKKLQPKDATPKEDPRAWFKFAGDAVLTKIHDRNRKWSWDYFKERRDDRRRYIELFKKTKANQQLSGEDSDDLNRLEMKLGYEDLRFWRSLARNQLRRENAEALKNQPPQPRQQQGWVSWVWGSKPAEQSTDAKENTQMTEEQRKELYEAIDWDEKAALADTVDVPRETVKMELNASLSTGSFTLRQSPHGTKTDLLSLHFDLFKAKAIKRPDSVLADISLGGFRVNDGTTPESLFKEIVRVKDAPDADSPRRLSIGELEDSSHETFFDLQVEQNPLDGQSDFAVTAKLKPLEIVWNPNFVVGVVDFFKPPDRHMESITALMESAGATVEGLRQQTRAGLEFALEEHKTFNAKLDLQAPLIIIPLSIMTERSTCLILDAGRINVDSELVDKATLKQVQDKQNQAYSEEDLKQLESLMYDKFIVKLTSTQVLIGPSIAETKRQLIEKDEELRMHVVEKINVDFVVALSILPKAPNLTKMKISGHMPVLHATASDTKYKSLMKLIEVAIPKFGNQKQQEEPATAKPMRPRLLSSASGHSGRSRSHHRRNSANPFLSHQTAIILEDDSDNDDEFEDAADGTSNQNLKLQQKNFEFKFSVDKLQGSLYKSDPDGEDPDKLLVDLIAENFDLHFYMRPFDMAAEVSLGSVTVDDFVENPPAEFKSIISSGDVEDRQKRTDLVRVKFTKVNRDSPEFMSVYDGIDTNVNVSISTINVVVTRKTLLTLLDFILVTFTNNNAPGNTNTVTTAKVTEEGDSDIAVTIVEPPVAVPQQEQGSMRVKVDLKAIRLILNNDGIRLATLSFTHADIGVFLSGKTMRIAAKLGDLTLVDDVNVGAAESSNFRRLVAIEGDELADFRYETFDSENTQTYPGYDSSIFLRAGSIKVNFLEEPFRKIIEFLVKFGKMQAIFNAARQAAANQAQQLQQSTSRFRFDVVINTPIIVFPRKLTADQPKRDYVTAYLGEIYAQNKFVPLDDSEASEIAMKLSAGMRKIRLTSLTHYSNDESEELEMIDHVDLGFNIIHAEHTSGSKRPDTEIEGTMTDINLRLTQYQLQFLLEISRSVPAAFATNSEASNEEAERDVDERTLRRAKTISSVTNSGNDHIADLSPELGSREDTWTTLDLVFSAHKIGLELINATEEKPVGDVDDASLSRFSLDDSKLKTRMLADGSLEAEFVIQSFTIFDSRFREGNKFKKIMTSSNKEVQQFMASISMTGSEPRSMIAVVAVDSPRVIFALDYLFAIQNFVTTALKGEEPDSFIDDNIADSTEVSDNESVQVLVPGNKSQSLGQGAKTKPTKEAPKMSISYRVNIVDAQIILIANPLSSSSEAIVLGTKQVLLAQQHSLTFSVSEVGMFLCRMDKFDTSRLRILDDFSIQASMDSSQPNTSSISISVEPLILRLSLRDILLVLQIVSKASEMSGNDDNTDSKPSAADQKAKQLRGDGLKQRTASGHGSTIARKTDKGTKTARTGGTGAAAGSSKQIQQAHDIVEQPQRHEGLTATLEGIRVVLIGDLHELPILDMSIRGFTTTMADWTSSLKGEAALDMYINIYNFAKSSWEPFIEPWQVGLGVAKDQSTGLLSVDIASKKTFDITVTTATIALASKSFDFFTQDQDVLGKPRGVEAPYKIRNYTGFNVSIQAKSQSNEDISANLEDGQEAPWSFEHWEKMRENIMSESNTANSVSVNIEGSGFDTVKNIRLNREGEFLYSLRPKADNVLHRLLVEVALGTDNVKYVTLRSPLSVENNTHISIELGVYDAQEGHLLKIEKIPPGQSRPAPVGAAYLKSLLVRPDSGFGYEWSTEPLWWRDLLKRPTRTLMCKGESNDPFYFQMNTIFEKGHFLAGKYPYMKLKLSPPVVLENLLPYDFKYAVYDKNAQRDWSNFLRKGGESPIHMIELSHLLLVSIDMQDTQFKASEYAIVNAPHGSDFKKEHKITCKDEEGLPLSLRLHYYKVPDGGGAFKVTVYSPYVILNKTGLGMSVRGKQFLQQARKSAGESSLGNAVSRERTKTLPFMFSFGSDDQRNRALIKIGDSEPSKPQSFDAIGSTTEVVLPSTTQKDTEISVGITVESGEGKYKLTKVVTIAPRFVIKNKLGEDIHLRQPGSSEFLTVDSGSLHPLHFLQRSKEKQLMLCYSGVDNQWSSPFNISDVGTTHIKIAKAGQRQKLIRVEILMEDATIFLHLSLETKAWPFSMRNESDTEFTFYQADPNRIHESHDSDGDRSGWRQIRYRLPPRSIMPYSWDFPSAKKKEVVLTAFGRERYVKLAEIGNQVPFKFPDSGGTQKIVDINVAADGPTQTLILSNFKAGRSLYRQKTMSSGGTSANSSTTGGFVVKKQDDPLAFQAHFRLKGIGVSLINQQLKELAYVTLRDIELKYNESRLHQTITTNIKWIQIDNQLYGGLFPMILYPAKVQQRAEDVELHPSLHIGVQRVKDDTFGVLYVKYFTVLLQEMTIELDEDFIYAVLDYSKVPGASWTQEQEGKLCDENVDVPEPKQEQSGQDIYFEALNIQPMQLNLSFMRTDRVSVDDKTSTRNPVMFLANVMTMAIGNINDAPIRMNALLIENARVSMPILIQLMSNHYSQEVLYQVHKIIGSADFLGNPVGLFNSISSGITDAFYEPYQGLLMSENPEDFGVGIAKGAASFVKNSVYGFSDSFSKFTGSVGKGLAAATLDKQFQDRRRITHARNRPKHALYGVTTGANSFFTSIASGLGGVARKPLEGAEQEGAVGFFKGVGKGFIGLATKPAVGVFDLASNVSEGIRNTTTVFDGSELDRVRIARFIPSDGVVRPYNQREALGQYWLKQVDNGKYFNEEYIAHLELPREDMVVMITFSRILLIRSKRLTTEWDVPLKDIQTISKERTGLSVVFRGGQNGPFIPVGEESGRAFLYKMVAVAVEEFNRRFKGLE
ncbi:vacuolar protein sorting-associated protein 13A/C [Microdochium nivale]|nr:vacuolar protein sorting-associated protein 13A/C [Microdochium nivale]